jgi:hypothetical protein
LMAYSESYAHMEAHAHTYEAIVAFSKACVTAGYPAKPRATQRDGWALLSPVSANQGPIESSVGDLLVKDPAQAVTAVQRYLDGKPWGYFGATCGAWASIHYIVGQAEVGYNADAKEWIVDIPRSAEALGPAVIRYHVDARSGLTRGDAVNDVTSDFAEGCDKY